MKLCDISPFGRYVRYLKITKNSNFRTVLPIDCRLFYVKKGKGRIKVDGEIINLPEGSILYINSFVPYTILKSDVRYLAINFDFTKIATDITTPIPPIPIEKKDTVAPIEKISFEDAPCFNRYLFIENVFSLSELFDNAEREFTEKPPFYILKNSAQISEIITTIYRKNEFKNAGEKSFNAENIAEYIREHLNEEMTNLSLAEHFHFHPNYLSNQFCRHYGKPIRAYILEMRITKAIALLEAGRSNIGEIALKVGFRDQNYFTRYFKKLTGTTPKAYLSKNST